MIRGISGVTNLRAVRNSARCRCGNWLPHGALARFDLVRNHGKPVKDWYDCHLCRAKQRAAEEARNV